MHSRPLSSLSRILLVTCAVGLGTSSFYGQDSTSSSAQASTSTPTAKPAAPADAPASRIDIFTGYSYLAPHGTVNVPGAAPDGSSLPVKYSSVDYGAIGSVSYFFNRYVGGQFEVGSHPDGRNDGFTTGSLGLIARYPGDVTPFVHVLAGGVRGGGPLHEPYTWGPALTGGVGMDYAMPFFGGHLGLRLFQVDYQYYHINFGPQSPIPEGGRANLDNVRLSTGLLFHFGSIVPPPPVTYSCAVTPASVYQGDPVTVTGTALNLNPKKTATYTWSGTGVTVKGDSNTGTIDTASLAPGTYPVSGHVTEGKKIGQFADCTANVVVKPFDPPTITCSANPSTIKPGDSSTITATGAQAQNRTLTYSYSASAGSVSGSGYTATLTTAGAPAGPITVTCDVADDKGGKAESTTTVNVEQPAPPPVPHVKTLCSINFERDAKRPARVDNEAKGCLDDVALALQQSSDATAVVVGSAAATEKKADQLAAQRAVNTKAYLVTEKGIDAGRVTVKTGDAGSKEVKNYLVPTGATFDTDIPGTKSVDDAKVKAQTRKAGPAKHKKHKKAAAAAK